MSAYSYTTSGVCSREIYFEIDGGKLRNVRFDGGCNGNLKAIGLLVEGADAQSISDLLRGNRCGMRDTSCADQLAHAIDLALEEEKKG